MDVSFTLLICLLNLVFLICGFFMGVKIADRQIIEIEDGDKIRYVKNEKTPVYSDEEAFAPDEN